VDRIGSDRDPDRGSPIRVERDPGNFGFTRARVDLDPENFLITRARADLDPVFFFVPNFSDHFYAMTDFNIVRRLFC